MTAFERVTVAVAALFLALAVAAGVYQVLTAGPYTIDGYPPLPVVVSQLGLLAAPVLVTVALGCIASLVFVRAARWRR